MSLTFGTFNSYCQFELKYSFLDGVALNEKSLINSWHYLGKGFECPVNDHHTQMTFEYINATYEMYYEQHVEQKYDYTAAYARLCTRYIFRRVLIRNAVYRCRRPPPIKVPHHFPNRGKPSIRRASNVRTADEARRHAFNEHIPMLSRKRRVVLQSGAATTREERDEHQRRRAKERAKRLYRETPKEEREAQVREVRRIKDLLLADMTLKKDEVELQSLDSVLAAVTKIGVTALAVKGISSLANAVGSFAKAVDRTSEKITDSKLVDQVNEIANTLKNSLKSVVWLVPFCMILWWLLKQPNVISNMLKAGIIAGVFLMVLPSEFRSVVAGFFRKCRDIPSKVRDVVFGRFVNKDKDSDVENASEDVFSDPTNNGSNSSKADKDLVEEQDGLVPGTVAKLIAALLCISVFKTARKSSMVTELMKRVSMVGGFSLGLEPFVKWVLTVVEKVANFFLSIFTDKRITLCRKNEPGYDAWRSRVTAMARDFDTVTMRNDPVVISEIQELIREGYVYRELYNGTNKHREICDALAKITGVLAPYAGSITATNNFRVEPAMVMMLGDPGIGKTTMIVPFLVAMGNEIGLWKEPPTREKIMRHMWQKGASKFWNGYVGQEFYIMDDAFQMRADQQDEENDYISIIKAVSSWAFPLNMADLMSKGRIYFKSKLILGTTNLTCVKSEAEQVIVKPEAVTRRISHPIKLFLKPEYMRPGTKEMDWEKLRVHTAKCRDNPDPLDRYPWYFWEVAHHNFLNGQTSEERRELQSFIREVAASLRSRHEQHESACADMEDYAAGFFPTPESVPQTCPAVQAHEQSATRSNPPPPAATATKDDDDYTSPWNPDGDDDDPTEVEEQSGLRSEYYEGRVFSPKIGDRRFYYNILGVQPNASFQDITRAYRDRSLIHHPDKGGDIRNFTLLRRAYSRICEREVRKRHDKHGYGRCGDYFDPKCCSVSWEFDLKVMLRHLAVIVGALTVGILLRKLVVTLLKGIASLFGISHKRDTDSVDVDSKVLKKKDAAWVPKLVKKLSERITGKGRITIDDVSIYRSADSPATVSVKYVDTVKKCTWKHSTSFSLSDIYAEDSAEYKAISKHFSTERENDTVYAQSNLPPIRLRHKPPRNVPVVLQTGDVNQCAELSEKIVANMMAITIPSSDNRRIGYATFINGSVAAQPAHFLDAAASLDPKTEVKFTALNSSLNFTVTASQWLGLPAYRVTDQDLVFIDYRLYFGGRKNIDRSLISAQDVTRLNNKHARLLQFEHGKLTTVTYTDIGTASHYDSPLTVVGTNKVIASRSWVYRNNTTVKGDCGAVLMYRDVATRGGAVIMGLHIAGTTAQGYSNVLTRELYEEARNALGAVRDDSDGELSKLVDMNKVELHSDAEHLSNGCFDVIGKAYQPAHTPLDSKYNVVPETWGAFGPYDHKPAHLRPFDINGERKYPMDKAVENYGLPLKSLDPTLVRPALWVAMKPLNELTLKSRRFILTPEEAVLGIPDEKFRSIPRNTSAGWPHCLSGRGKFKFFGTGSDYDLSSPEWLSLKSIVLEKEHKAKLGLRSAYVFMDFLKDELRESAKVDEGKTRLISSAPIDYVVLWRMYFGAFSMAFMQNHTLSGMAPGICAYSDWSDLASVLQRKGPLVFDGDFKFYDATEQPSLHWPILDFINEWYDDGPVNATVRKVLWYELVHSRHIGGRGHNQCVVYQWYKSLPSGHPFTTIVNSMYSLTVIVASYGIATGDVYSFWDKCGAVTYGDDNVINPHSTIADSFNQVTLASILLDNFGMTYTPGRKDGKWVPTTTIENVTFLKRSFRYEASQWVAPLELSSFLYTCYYSKNKELRDDIIRDNLELALSELSLHPEVEWHKYSATIRKLMRDFEHSPRFEFSRSAYQKYILGRVDLWY